MVTVGIPRALSYYNYFPFWKTLAEGLGAEVAVSGPTDERLLKLGVRHCVDDICVPVKLFFGHVLDLKDRVDYLFVPRLVSVERSGGDSYTCPKLMGLPDMIKGALDGLPPVIEFRLDLKNHSLKHTARTVARSLPGRGGGFKASFRSAVSTQALYQRELLGGADPAGAMRKVLGENGDGGRARPAGRAAGRSVNIALVGHDYLVHDPFISHDLPGRLASLGANVTFTTQVPQEAIERELALYPDISWSFEKVLLGATSHFMRRGDIHGVIIVMGFACGPDSIVGEIISREVRRDSATPVMVLVLDEHTGEAGVATRAEAFVDMVRRSRGR